MKQGQTTGGSEPICCRRFRMSGYAGDGLFSGGWRSTASARLGSGPAWRADDPGPECGRALPGRRPRSPSRARVLHNFVWHQRWTWRDRPAPALLRRATRLAASTCSTAPSRWPATCASMAILTGTLGIDPIAANVDRNHRVFHRQLRRQRSLVFRTAPRVVAALALLVTSASPGRRGHRIAAELTRPRSQAWQQYERAVDERYEPDAPQPPASPFFAQDALRGPENRLNWRQVVGGGHASRIDRASAGRSRPAVPDGSIHHWAGAVFIPGVALGPCRQAPAGPRRPGVGALRRRDGVEAALPRRRPATVFMKLRRDKRHHRHLQHRARGRVPPLGARARRAAASRRRSPRLADAGTPREREKPVGSDHGFLWRLNAYWRYEQVDGGVLIECESVSLSRGRARAAAAVRQRNGRGHCAGIAREDARRACAPS